MQDAVTEIAQAGRDLEQACAVVVLQEARHGDDRGDVAVRERVGDLVALPQCRQRREHGADAQRPERDGQPVDAIRTEETDARAFRHAEADELARRGATGVAQFRGGHARGDAIAGRVREHLARGRDGGNGVEEGAERLHHLPVNTGGRFSTKARTASW